MDVLKLQLGACEVGMSFQMANELSTRSSIKKKIYITSITGGLTHTHSTLELGILYLIFLFFYVDY